MTWLHNLWRFSRPHTIIGTTLSLLTLFVLAGALTGRGLADGVRFGWALLACLGANVFIVGLNQLTDVAIDRINKPYLPLASGAFSMLTGRAIIFTGLAVSLVVALWQGPFLLLTVGLSLVLGIAYSLPPVRLKRFPFWAAFCIIAVRGFIVNLLLYLHFQYSWTGDTAIPPVVWLLTATIFCYSIIIAWFKDMPDVEGDDAHAIQTYSINWGVARVFRYGNYLLAGLYLLLILLPFIVDLRVQPWIFAGLHLLLLGGLFLAGRRVSLVRQASIKRYYLTVWGFFFAEYIGFALAGTLA